MARIVFRDPERAMRVVLDALPDQTRFDQMLAPVFASPAGLTATFGELAGTKGWLAPRAERHARAAAERTAASFVAEVREWQWHHAGAVRLALEAEREARAAAAAIPVPGLSAAAQQALEQIQGTNEDWIWRQYRGLSGTRLCKGDPGLQRGGRTEVRVCGDDRAGVAATRQRSGAVRAGAAAA